MKRTPLRDRALPPYTRAEEIANMTTHIAGAAIGVVTMLLGIYISLQKGNVWGLVSSVIYSSTVILLFTVSSVYHGLRPSYAKKVMQVIDHSTIFFLICGTYTPILLSSVRVNYPVVAWIVFGCEWGLALFGAVIASIDHKRYARLTMICYIGMGWAIIFSIGDMYRCLGPAGFWLLLSGGIAYTGGTIFYKLGNNIRYFHSIFHIFTLIGSILHSLCVIFYVL